MPVIVVGADTHLGETIISALAARGGEIRAFVSDAARGATLRAQGVKVAVGDLSDGSHLVGAAHDAFTAVFIEAALLDGRPCEFAADSTAVVTTWKAAISEAGVQRAIWVGAASQYALAGFAPEFAVVVPEDRSDREIALDVADLNDRRDLTGGRAPI
jgi:uncharacterized protein YbjT (DUF2867 family)